MSLKTVDDRQEPDEDSYETENKLIRHFEKIYDLNFQFDASAQDYNTKCKYYTNDALHDEWYDPIFGSWDVWLNGSHSMTEELIKRADVQHKKYNINICMLLPANVQSTGTWHKLIENETETFVENHPVLRRPTFFKNGRKTKHSSRNAYRVIIWRKR